MKINLKAKRARIELIPLLDMIFLVLVSFIYTFMAMTIQKGIPVRLPYAESAVEDKTDYLVITITKDNFLYVNKKRIAFAGLVNELLNRKAETLNLKIFLNADKGILYDHVMRVIDTVRKAGFEKISLETAFRSE